MSDEIDTSFEAVELLAFQGFTGDPATLSGTLRALRAERDAAVARAEAAEAEVRRLQEAGQAVLLARDWHHHEPSADDVDTCRVCGRDVRHPVHLGEGPRDLVERDAVENLRAALRQYEGGE